VRETFVKALVACCCTGLVSSIELVRVCSKGQTARCTESKGQYGSHTHSQEC
jgi:hypothetical protein